MKKFLNYLGEACRDLSCADSSNAEREEFHRILREFLDHDQPMAMLPAGDRGV
jgi:hypothetical protein